MVNVFISLVVAAKQGKIDPEKGKETRQKQTATENMR